MTFNSLLMFDIVFVFFLFLVGVTCLVYYLPPAKSSSNNSSASSCTGSSHSTYCRHKYSDHHHLVQHHCHHNHHRHLELHPNEHSHHHHEHQHQHPHPHQHLNSHRKQFIEYRPYRECCANNVKIITNSCDDSVELYTPDCCIDIEKSLSVATTPTAVADTPAAAAVSPQCCYVKAKPSDVKDISGPIEDV